MKYKKSTLKQLIIYFVLISILISNIFIFHIKNIFLILGILGIFITTVIFFLGYEKNRLLYRKNMILSIIISTLSFQIIYYLLGLYFGFVRNAYSLTFINIIKNLIPNLLIIIFTEFLRYCLNTKSQKNKMLLFLSITTFVLFDIVLQIHLYNLSLGQDIIKLFSSVILPSIAKNLLLTYLSIHYGYMVNIIYRIILELPIYFIPIYPSLGIYIEAIIMICFPILVFYQTYKRNYENEHENNPKRSIFFQRVKYGIILVIMLVVISLTSGVFNYMAITIGSGSMVPTINKGDVVIVKKIKDKEIEDIKVGEIIAFKYRNKIIMHRVIKIDEKDSYYSFQTKGDHNNSKDSWIITKNELIGKCKVKIPFLGYPTVWLNEIVKEGKK